MKRAPEKLVDILAYDGIRSLADLDAKRANNVSRYGYLVKNYGTVNADRIMRMIEVQKWFTPRDRALVQGKAFE